MSRQIIIHPARVAGGKLILVRQDEFKEALTHWKDCRAVLSVEKLRAHRSKPQNAYYFAVVVEMCSDATGYDENEMHEHGERKTLDVLLLSEGPEDVARDTIDEITGYKRSSRDAYLTRLKARGLVEFSGRGTVQASAELFA